MTGMTAVSAPRAAVGARRLTVSERVYHQLKQMIARGELGAGAPLVIRDLADKLKVSRTPVVEAIRRAERDGLVTVASKWGATVKEWSWDEIVEAFHIRAALEGEAVQLFVRRATPQDKQRLIELNTQFNQYASRDDRVRCDETDVELHLHIARSTRFPRLSELIENSNIERTAIWGATMKGSRCRNSDRRRINVGVHDPLVRALQGDDPEAARIELLKDIKKSLELISAWRKAEEDSACEP
jgi:DNA-binding GntR family transcriptional regulator